METIEAQAAGLVVVPQIDGYLTPTVGTVSTPDPGLLPSLHTFVFKIRGPAPDGTVIAAQASTTTGLAWKLEQYAGYLGTATYATGDGGGQSNAYATHAVTGADEHLALAVTLNQGGNRHATLWSATDEGWAPVDVPLYVTAALAVFDSTDPVTIGYALTGAVWPGRIYSVELRTGLNPAGGSVIWRFDANDYTSGTSYTDPRGRTWTMTASGAITPKVPATVAPAPSTVIVAQADSLVQVPQVDGYLTPTVGTVTTPDPGPLPAEFTVAYKVRGPLTGPGSVGTVASQMWTFNTYSWRVTRYADPVNDGATQLTTYGAGQAGQQSTSTIRLHKITGTDETVALSVKLDNGAGLRNLTGWRHDGAGFIVEHTIAHGPALAVLDDPERLSIGSWDNSQTQRFDGRIYWVEMRTGLDPAGGTLVWRFDANDYPGTGTSYVDPRGRTWTLTTAGAITPKVPAYVEPAHATP